VSSSLEDEIKVQSERSGEFEIHQFGDQQRALILQRMPQRLLTLACQISQEVA